MGDSLFYTDDQLELMDNISVENSRNIVNKFIENCQNVLSEMSSFSEKMNQNDVEQLNINDKIIGWIDSIKKIENERNDLNLSEKEKIVVNELCDKLKSDVVALKNKHIAKYNVFVDYINVRVNDLTTKLSDEYLSSENRQMLESLETIQRCEVYINNDWQQSSYLESLDYEKLNESYKKVSSVEKKLKIKSDEPIELWSNWYSVNKNINILEDEIKENMTVIEIDSLLNKCVSMLESIIDLDLQHESKRDELSKEMFSKYSRKITRLNTNLKKIEETLLEKKNVLQKKSSDYTINSNNLELIDKKYEVVRRKISEYQRKCSEKSIVRFNYYLDKYQKDLIIYKNKIEQDKNNGTLNEKQLSNLEKKIEQINSKHEMLYSRVNHNPYMLREEDELSYFVSRVDGLEIKITQLNDKIKKIDGVIKDKSQRKDIDSEFKLVEKEIKEYDKILSFYKNTDSEKYELLKAKLGDTKNNLETVDKNYRGKCPLMVKSVKSTTNFFKKHKKECLVIAGLAALALVSYHVLIPAIMHGNIMIAATSPVLRPFIKFTNNILGSVIGATRDVKGIWRLASGFVINPACGTSSLLKGVAISGITSAALVSPIVVAIKKLVEKMKTVELRQKLTDNLKNGKETVKKATDGVKKKATMVKSSLPKNYDKLLKEYVASDMSLDEFCEVKGLNDNEKEIIYYKEKLNEALAQNRSKKRGS